MTGEGAIKRFESLIAMAEDRIREFESCWPSWKSGFRKDKELYETALAALLAQKTPTKLDRSRWEGCPHCTFGTEELLVREIQSGWKRGKSAISGADEMYILRYSPKDYSLICLCSENYAHEMEIKVCPFCGRPLTEEAWAELERRIGNG